jgi:hypothetical protein
MSSLEENLVFPECSECIESGEKNLIWYIYHGYKRIVIKRTDNNGWNINVENIKMCFYNTIVVCGKGIHFPSKKKSDDVLDYYKSITDLYRSLDLVNVIYR